MMALHASGKGSTGLEHVGHFRVIMSSSLACRSFTTGTSGSTTSRMMEM